MKTGEIYVKYFSDPLVGIMGGSAWYESKNMFIAATRRIIRKQGEQDNVKIETYDDAVGWYEEGDDKVIEVEILTCKKHDVQYTNVAGICSFCEEGSYA